MEEISSEKKEAIFSLLTNDMIMHPEKPRESTDIFLKS